MTRALGRRGAREADHHVRARVRRHSRSALRGLDAPARWLGLLIAIRIAAGGVAAALLLAQNDPRDDLVLLGTGLTAAAVGTLVIWRRPGARRRPELWVAEAVAGLALIAWSGDWRSPFYLLWLTTLVLPAVHLGVARASGLAAVATGAFLAVALLGGPVPGRFAFQSSETLAIHLTLPGLVVLGVAYAAGVLRRLDQERAGRERLAVETERRRIAWELHDSAKQRVHAAHLLFSALRGRTEVGTEAVLEQGLAELESAVSDMDTSLAELRSPLEGRPLLVALEQRARELSLAGGACVEVRGDGRPLPALVAAHAYRIASEAMTNAVRHAAARRVVTRVDLAAEAPSAVLRVTVVDDGRGMPGEIRSGALGLMGMRSRATSLGGSLEVREGPDGTGTEVALEVPLGDGTTTEQEGTT